jgi:hypothetical protein
MLTKAHVEAFLLGQPTPDAVRQEIEVALDAKDPDNIVHLMCRKFSLTSKLLALDNAPLTDIPFDASDRFDDVDKARKIMEELNDVRSKIEKLP